MINVPFNNLKIKIAITLALLLLIAVTLTNFVLFRIIEKNIIENHFKTGRNWIVAMHEARQGLEKPLQQLSDHDNLFFPGIVFAFFSGEPENPVFSRLDEGVIDLRGRVLMDHVQSTGRPAHQFVGREWGVFWKRSKYLVVGAPLPDGAGVVVIELGPDYEMLRNSQQVATGYLFLNFLILFAVGFYRFSTLVIRPIHRFIQLTDNHRYSEPFDFFPEKQNDEFSRLSSALNRMMRRIDTDRQELEQSIDTIEAANRDLKRAQQEIIKAEKLASIGRLSAGIAHEIGNPISVVLGYLGLLKNRSISPDDSSGRDYIERAETEINRVNSIIRQLLDFSRAGDSGFTDFSVHDLLYDTGRMLSQQPLMENIRLVFDFFATHDIVRADYNQLHQVIVNLVINAADSISATENADPGEIRFVTSASEDNQRLLIEIQDNGCGVSDENKDKVFDPFFTTKETGKGTGLGLYVSYMIIEQFGGSISVQNNTAGGTRIRITLPLTGSSTKTVLPKNAEEYE